ncbi:uncharacterized protein LOC129741639 [Uranotaenia lowii]|uniref:uncharacterized protein LOC129741639 n=1 Tax=Uranotaenia lowii TaxID=190385 RepID=UPI002479AABE|nr:uncharacterized protein LOC129741639 [Uranotaenia lowii]
MGNYIQSFLTNRTARVFIDGKYSAPQVIHDGVPQGSVIAPTLFLIGLQSVFRIVPEDTEILAYADDLILISSSPYSRIARKKLQLAVDKISTWAPTVGFTFAPEKSKLMHLGPHRKRLRKIPPLKMQNKNIPLVRSARILGVWIDDQLRFTKHINCVRNAAKRKLNILKKLCCSNWAGSRSSLHLFVHGWLLPTILHGVGFFSRGPEKVLEKLEPLYNQAIRYISGCFKSSPIPSLMVESGQLPFKYILTKALSIKTIRWLSLNRNQEVPMVHRAQMFLNRIQASIPAICPRYDPRLQKWNASTPKVDLSLLSKIKAGTNPSYVLPHFYHLVERKYKDVPKLYTDGSKTLDGRVGCGITSENINVSLPLPSICSVFSSEAFALLSAAQNYCPTTQSVIFSDSASVLKGVSVGNIKHPWIVTLSEVAIQKGITLCWIPGHSNIAGNERADHLAAAGSQLDPQNQTIPSPDALKWVKRHITLAWSQTWNIIAQNKLREVKNTTEAWIDRASIRERRILTRLRIGHTRLTHGYLMAMDDPPMCFACQVQLSIKHILLNCPCYQQARIESGLGNSLRQILSNCPIEEKKIILFLQKSNLMDQI